MLGTLRAAESGRGGVLLVEGESGMGKSRLLGHAIDMAAELGLDRAGGMADEAGRLMPLAPLVSALGESAQSLRAAQGVLRSDAVDLRLWLVEQLQVRLEERAARGPLLVTLDDLHWADPTTLLALRSLIPELASYPLVWILSRTTGSGGAGGSADAGRLYDVLERDGAVRLVVGPLDDQAAAEVVADVLGAVPEPDLLTLAAGAGGNPFMLVELAEGLRDEGAVEVVGGRVRLVSRRLPRRVQVIVRRRLGRLSSRTRHLLQVAAVLGRSFSVDDLAGMLGEPASRLLPVLEEAQEAGTVVASGEVLMFRHDLLWRAVTGTVSEPVRQALHRQAGEMLLDRGGSAIPAAGHLMYYARPGDVRALEALDRAVREVLPSSPETAADLAGRALELTASGDPGRFERTVTAVYALTAGGRLSQAAEVAREALGQPVTSLQAARLRYELAYVLMLAGRSADAATEAEALLVQDELPDELRGMAEQVLFRALFATHEYWRVRERAEAVVAAGDNYSPVAQVGAHMLLTTAAWSEGRAADSIAHIREAARLASGGPIRAQHAHPTLHLAHLLMNMRRLEEAETILEAATEEIKALGHTAYAASPALFRARLRLAEDRLEDAGIEAQAGLAMADELGMRAFVLMGIAVLAIVAVRRGDLDAAAREVEHYEAEHRAGRGVMFGVGWGDWVRAVVSEAHLGAERTIRAFPGLFSDPSLRCWLLMSEPSAAPCLSRMALAAGERSYAEIMVTQAEKLAWDNPDFTTLSASAAHARGILDADTRALTRAAATHAGIWNRASAVEDLGTVLAATVVTRADRADAVHALDQALDGYQRTGARRDAARVRARLRRLGVRRLGPAPERPATGWAGLTDTERSVATLVGQGLTNPQVAARMSISPNTVKFQLFQVFRKLGIASRLELTRLAHESG